MPESSNIRAQRLYAHELIPHLGITPGPLYAGALSAVRSGFAESWYWLE